MDTILLIKSNSNFFFFNKEFYNEQHSNEIIL